MLILARKKEESLIINGNIEIKILDATDGKVKLGIVAPRDVEVHRKEIYEKILTENREAATGVKNFKVAEKGIKSDSDKE